MATYDYKCTGCGLVEEVVHGMNETPDVHCPCGHKCVKHLTPESTGMTRKTGDDDLTDWEEVKYRRHG